MGRFKYPCRDQKQVWTTLKTCCLRRCNSHPSQWMWIFMMNKDRWTVSLVSTWAIHVVGWKGTNNQACLALEVPLRWIKNGLRRRKINQISLQVSVRTVVQLLSFPTTYSTEQASMPNYLKWRRMNKRLDKLCIKVRVLMTFEARSQALSVWCKSRKHQLHPKKTKPGLLGPPTLQVTSLRELRL